MIVDEGTINFNVFHIQDFTISNLNCTLVITIHKYGVNVVARMS